MISVHIGNRDEGRGSRERGLVSLVADRKSAKCFAGGAGVLNVAGKRAEELLSRC